MSTTRPETLDDHGVRHRHGCPRPGWHVENSRALPGWCLYRCAGCGAITLGRVGWSR